MIVARAVRIVAAAASLACAALVERLHPTERGFPVRLRRAFERLGPTFVKLGQALSQRPDLLPSAWTGELSRLQAAASPFSPQTAAELVEAALGAPPHELFARFEPEPLAAASVAQVHAARLHDGREVVVKILRPGVRAQIDQDMRVLLALASMGGAFVPRLRRRRAVEVVREIWRNLRRETDLREEARSIRRFARAFRDSPSVHIPDVIDGLSAQGVLVQEMGHGCGIADPSLAPRAGHLSKAFVEFYLRQFFVLGTFHADPHPGNILVTPDGRLCFHDFGAVGMLDARSRRALLAFMQAFSRRDPDWLTDAAFDLGLLSGAVDRQEVARGVEAILADLEGAPLRDWSIGAVMTSIVRLGGGDAVLIPPHLAALVRTVFTAEGTLRILDPDLDLPRTLAECGEALLTSGAIHRDVPAKLARLRWEAVMAGGSLIDLVASALHDAFQRAQPSQRAVHPAGASERLGRAADRIAVALVAMGLYVAASLLAQQGFGPRLGGIPWLAAVGYGLAAWFTFRLVRSIDRTGGL